MITFYKAASISSFHFIHQFFFIIIISFSIASALLEEVEMITA